MTGKTLKELNVQVGDVVARDGYSDNVGYAITLHEIETDKRSGFRIVRRTKYTDWKFGTAPDGADTHVMPDGAVAWRVKVEPEIGSMTVYFSDRFKFTYTTIDGVPDCASVKMELLE